MHQWADEDRYWFVQLFGFVVGMTLGEATLQVMTNHIDRQYTFGAPTVLSCTCVVVCFSGIYANFSDDHEMETDVFGLNLGLSYIYIYILLVLLLDVI